MEGKEIRLMVLLDKWRNLMEMFDIVVVRWANLFMGIILIIYSHTVARKMKSFYIAVPLIIWLVQVVLFYFIFLLYHYEFITMSIVLAERFFSYWGTFSTTLGLITFFLYLFYIQRSCWRGNGK
jgi:hypothetical protein